jgi:hypothetical protein
MRAIKQERMHVQMHEITQIVFGKAKLIAAGAASDRPRGGQLPTAPISSRIFPTMVAVWSGGEAMVQMYAIAMA